MKKNLILISVLAIASTAWGQKFRSDDPLLVEPKPRDAGALKSRKLSDYYDLFLHQFGHPGERQPEKKSGKEPIRAKAVNTLGEPFDRAWWEPRHYYRPMSIEQLQRGAGDSSAPSRDGKWLIVGAKAEGITPGFQMLDSKKRRYFVKFDPLTNPEMATSADTISSKLAYALGYNVPENYLIYFTEEQLELGEKVELTDVTTGKKRKMSRRDLVEILMKVPRTADGKIRGTASLALPGKPIGPPRYFGTRSDDPNDIVPHEHRRDQRGLHVLFAWIAHDDSRSINNLDILAERDGVKFVKHYLLDFGSTLGSASTGPNSPRSGAYFFSWSESAKNFFSLGLRVPYWAKAHYPNQPSVGKFESKIFDAEQWVPEYPNPALLDRLPDDEFWMAKQVVNLSNADIKAIVATAQMTDTKSADYLAQCLIERRDKIGKTYFAKVLPVDRFAARNGALVWEDLSAKHGLGGAGAVDIQWHKFDNAANRRTAIAGAQTPSIPSASAGEILCAELTQRSAAKHKAFVYLRGDQVVGIDREW